MSTPPTSVLGMGFCPMGFSIFGFGSPATAGTETGNLLQQSNNSPSADARLIDPYTRDYVIDADGVVTGQSSVAQQVFLAIMTTLGSSVEANLGSQFSRLKTFDQSTFQAKITNIVQQALSSLIKSGTIRLLSVVASQNANGVAGNVLINWVDQTTNTINQTKV
jgi:phage gp46-like protein